MQNFFKTVHAVFPQIFANEADFPKAAYRYRDCLFSGTLLSIRDLVRHTSRAIRSLDSNGLTRWGPGHVLLSNKLINLGGISRGVGSGFVSVHWIVFVDIRLDI